MKMSEYLIEYNEDTADATMAKLFGIKIDETVDRERIVMELDLIYETRWIDLIQSLFTLKEVLDENNIAPLTGGGIGASYIAYLNGLTIINPLKPHFRCSVCGRIIYKNTKENIKSGYDEKLRIAKCHLETYADGHDIPPEMCYGTRSYHKEPLETKYYVPKEIKEKIIEKYIEKGHSVNAAEESFLKDNTNREHVINIDNEMTIRLVESDIVIPKDWFEEFSERYYHFDNDFIYSSSERKPTDAVRQIDELFYEELLKKPFFGNFSDAARLYGFLHSSYMDDACKIFADREEVMNILIEKASYRRTAYAMTRYLKRGEACNPNADLLFLKLIAYYLGCNVEDLKNIKYLSRRTESIGKIIAMIYKNEMERKSIIYKGIFWKEDEIVSPLECVFKVPSDEDGNVLEKSDELTSKKGDNFNHKKSWEKLDKWRTRNKPFDYYPRGRVEIRHGKAIIYANPNICGDKLIAWCKEKFNLYESNGIRDIKCKPDYSEHYKCYLDREGEDDE